MGIFVFVNFCDNYVTNNPSLDFVIEITQRIIHIIECKEIVL